MTEVARDPECRDEVHKDTEKLFGKDCSRCGKIFQYADDTTYHISNYQRPRNLQKLTQNLQNFVDFLVANQLSVNRDKTHIEEIMIKQKRGRQMGHPPELLERNHNQEIETIKVKGHCRILGLNIQNDLTWNSHMETGPKPLLPSLRKNIGALRSLGEMIPFKSRNTVARGMILGRLSYLISIWGGATPNIIRKVQRTQNEAARWVTGMARTTRIATLLEATGWNSIQEMSRISSATLIWKAIYQKTPGKLSEEIDWNRQTTEINTTEPRINFTRNKFTFRACREWNEIPQDIRTIQNIGNFKRHMKKWIRKPETQDARLTDRENAARI